MDNIHPCEHCGTSIDYDQSDWCSHCDTSIFDDKKCPQCKEDKLKIHKGAYPWDDVEYWICPTCDSTFGL